MRDLINGFFTNPAAHNFLNTEFPSLSPGLVVNNRKFAPSGPEYKAVCKEVYLAPSEEDKNRMSGVLIVRPDVQDLIDFVIQTGFKDQSGFNYEGLLREGQDGTGEILDQNLKEAKNQDAEQKAMRELLAWTKTHKVEQRKVDRWTGNVDTSM